LDQLAFHKPFGFIFLGWIAIGNFILLFKFYDPIFFFTVQVTEYLIVENVEITGQLLRK